MSISIIPLCVGFLKKLPKTILIGPRGFGLTVDIPCIMWYLKGTKENIIIDTGPSDPDLALKYHNREVEKLPEHDVEKALASVGVDINDINIVINTHLHWDHCCSNEKFKNAVFISQRKELQYAVAPLPLHADAYEVKVPKVPFLSVLNKTKLVSGEKDIAPGVKVIPLPGHTPGQQGVLVNCKNTNYLIAGDCIALYEGLHERLLSSIYVNLEEYYESLEKIESLNAVVLPGHDIKVFEQKEYS